MRGVIALALLVHALAPGIAAAVSRQDAASPILGDWTGALRREGAELPIQLKFVRTPTAFAGTFTSPTQRVMEYPLDTVSTAGSSVRFSVGGGSLVLDGMMRGDSIVGSYTEEGTSGEFTLLRASPPALPYRREDLKIPNGGVVLAGSLYLPDSAAPHPAVVFLHGSGPEVRWGTARYYADRLARAGVAALIFDKRGTGESTGDWRTATFEDLAGDAIAIIRTLQRRADINPGRIGLYGHSQGGLIAPLAASMAPGLVAFLVAGATYPDSAWQQDIYRVGRSIQDEGFSEAEVARAMEHYTLFVDVARGVRPWEELEAAAAPVRGERWYEWLGIPPRDHWLWSWYPKTGNFQALPHWERVRVPVLLLFGERDQLVPVAKSLRLIENALEHAGNRTYTSVIVPRAAHNLTVTPEPGEPFDFWRAAPGLIELVVAWVAHVAGGRAP